MNGTFEKVKQTFYGNKLPDEDFISNVLDAENYRKKFREIPILKNHLGKLDELFEVLANYFDFLEKNEIYKIDYKTIQTVGIPLVDFSSKLKVFIDLIKLTKDLENSILKTYITANIYRSIYEINRHILQDLIMTLAVYLKDKVSSIAKTESETAEVYKQIYRILDKKEKYGVTDFFFLNRLIDRQFKTKFTGKFEAFFNVPLRNAIVHEKVIYSSSVIKFENSEKVMNNSDILDNITLTMIFLLAFIFNDRGYSMFFSNLLKDTGLNRGKFSKGMVELIKRMVSQ